MSISSESRSRDSADTRGDDSIASGGLSQASERFRLDIPDLFAGSGTGKGRTESQSREPVQLAHAGHANNDYGATLLRSAGDKNGSENAASGAKPEQAQIGRTNSSEGGDRVNERLAEKQFSEFAKNNGLDLKVGPDKKIEFSLVRSVEKVVIGNVEPTKAGLQEISKTVKEMTELKKWDLEQRFGIQFAKPGGDLSVHQQVPQKDGSTKSGQKLELREPRLSELMGIEAALEKANPSHKAEDGARPLTFYFLKDKTFYQGAGGVATFEPNINGGPAVVVEPKSLVNSPITEQERKNNDFTAHRSIASVITHELAHHTEERINPTLKDKTETYRQIGWTPIPGKPASAGGEQHWMLKGPNGEGYAPAGLAKGDWIRFDANGKRLGKISPEQAANLALVKPSTKYFEGPHEMLAEGLTMLRIGDSHRSHLMNRDQSLYQTIKAADQKDIDKSYGAGQFMRSYSGHVVPRNAENLRALQQREMQERR